jgi:hypothetical protein
MILANRPDHMSLQRIAGINAILFFFFWLFILLAGADFPPPMGFLWIVLVVAACARTVQKLGSRATTRLKTCK